MTTDAQKLDITLKASLLYGFIISNIYQSTDGVAGKFKGSTVMPFLCILKK